MRTQLHVLQEDLVLVANSEGYSSSAFRAAVEVRERESHSQAAPLTTTHHPFLLSFPLPSQRLHSCLLLSAAADMGHHAIALSYASLPTAVSQMNLWCTRPGANATLCNIELHENVLFGGMQQEPHPRAYPLCSF